MCPSEMPESHSHFRSKWKDVSLVGDWFPFHTAFVIAEAKGMTWVQISCNAQPFHRFLRFEEPTASRMVSYVLKENTMKSIFNCLQENSKVFFRKPNLYNEIMPKCMQNRAPTIGWDGLQLSNLQIRFGPLAWVFVVARNPL